jgi:ABC-type nickel/cobalt efflux system permease component RcnA
VVEIDGNTVTPTIDRTEIPPPLEIRAGVAVIRLFLRADLPSATGAHRLFYENNHFADRGVYIVNAISDDPEQVEISNQDRDVFQKSVVLDYLVLAAQNQAKETTAVPATEPPTDGESQLPAGVSTEGQRWLTNYLYETDFSPLLFGLMLVAAIALGGLHALTPGHGKTLVAAYLIGSRGTVKDAMFLGGIVTFTHTASVIVIGILALAASQFIVPNVLVPALEVLSGLLVVFIGLQLIWTRWRATIDEAGDHHHHEHHHHRHEHSHGDPHSHTHAPQEPDHHHQIPDRVTVRDLLALGVSGGLVPCPEALGIMLIAIGLNRILLGLGMVVAFSFGLAVVLIVIGVMLVRAKSLLDGVGNAGQRWQTWLPLISAIIVTLLGVAIMLKGLWSYLGGSI